MGVDGASWGVGSRGGRTTLGGVVKTDRWTLRQWICGFIGQRDCGDRTVKSRANLYLRHLALC